MVDGFDVARRSRQLAACEGPLRIQRWSRALMLPDAVGNWPLMKILCTFRECCWYRRCLTLPAFCLFGKVLCMLSDGRWFRSCRTLLAIGPSRRSSAQSASMLPDALGNGPIVKLLLALSDGRWLRCCRTLFQLAPRELSSSALYSADPWRTQ